MMREKKEGDILFWDQKEGEKRGSEFEGRFSVDINGEFSGRKRSEGMGRNEEGETSG